MGKALQFSSRQAGACEQQEGLTNTLWKQNTHFWSALHKNCLTGDTFSLKVMYNN